MSDDHSYGHNRECWFRVVSPDKTDDPSLVGTWEREYYDSHEGEYCLERFTFNSNGTGHYIEFWDKDEKHGGYKNVEADDDFTYKYNSQQMALELVWLSDGDKVVMIIETLTDNLLVISNAYTDERPQGKLTEKAVFKRK